MGAVSSTSSVTRHLAGVGAQALVVAAIITALLLALAPAYRPADILAGTERVAAAGRGVSGNSITVVGASDTARIAVAYGSTVTTYSTLGRDYFYLFVRTQCWSGDLKLYESWINIKTGDATTGGYASFTMSSSTWQGGGGTCNADLINATWKGKTRVYEQLATTSFDVAG